MGPRSNDDLVRYFDRSIEALSSARQAFSDDRAERAISLITTALIADRPLLVCGNGGSAADAMHITGELVGRFLKERRALRVICLCSNPAVITAWANDRSYDDVFARQVEAYAQPGGVLMAISTSGNSPSVVRAAERAREHGMSVIALTGDGGGRLAANADILLDVPSRSTPFIQQIHICLYHHLCAEVEARIAT